MEVIKSQKTRTLSPIMDTHTVEIGVQVQGLFGDVSGRTAKVQLQLPLTTRTIGLSVSCRNITIPLILHMWVQ